MNPTRHFDDVMTSRPLFVPGPKDAGAFQVESHGEEGVRLVMREPHFANNVRYVLIVDRANGTLRARWSDTEDDGAPSLEPEVFLEVGLA